MRAFNRAGLKTIAQVADRGRAELASRFGGGFVTRLDVMLGAEEKPLAPRRPLPDFRTEQRFAEPVVTKEVIAASLHTLAISLSGMLERDGQGLRHLEAFFFRADGKVERIVIKTGAPLRDAAVMLGLLNERLDALADPLDPGFGFDVIRLEASLTEKNQTVTASFDDNENSRWQVAFLVDRLAARFGEHRVQRFVPQDTHIPEAQGVAIPAQERDSKESGCGYAKTMIRRFARSGCWKNRKKSALCSWHRRARPGGSAGARPISMSHTPKGLNASPWNGGRKTASRGIISGSKPTGVCVSGSIAMAFGIEAGPHAPLVSARHFRVTAHTYAELAVTTNFSFLRGASHPHELVQQAAKLWLCRHRHRRPQYLGGRGARL